MQSHEGQIIELSPATVFHPKSVSRFPLKVAVLVDRKCASSCEDFVLTAKQSTKVTIIGSENTAGVHDYGNLRKVYLPGWRQMMVPTTRERGPRMDFVGITPDVVLPQNSDAITSARRLLER
jgi:C-terminal processing protease CtpA/Prc